MQTQLDDFTAVYNTQRTHRALPPGTTPAQAYRTVLSSHQIDPDRDYWRNQNKNPGRWPGNL